MFVLICVYVFFTNLWTFQFEAKFSNGFKYSLIWLSSLYLEKNGTIYKNIEASNVSFKFIKEIKCFIKITINKLCVTEQHYVSIFFTRLWSVHTALISDVHAFKHKTKRQSKTKRIRKKKKKHLLDRNTYRP